MDAGVAALIGAGISGVVALAAQLLAGVLATRTSRRDRLSTRLTAYLSSTHGLALSIGHLARSPISEKANAEADRVWAYSDAVNAALAEIELHDPVEIVVAVQQLDQALVVLTRAAREHQFSREEWRSLRAATLDEPVGEVKAVARRHVR